MLYYKVLSTLLVLYYPIHMPTYKDSKIPSNLPEDIELLSEQVRTCLNDHLPASL
jgi:hypothetical protein